MARRLNTDFKVTARRKSSLGAEATRQHAELCEWQIAEIRVALEEADAGDFATDQDVDALRQLFGVQARNALAASPTSPGPR